MSITVTFDPPLPSDSPSVFNTKAFTLLGDLNDWSTEANALASTVNSNASTSATNASNASSSASAAATSASNAAAIYDAFDDRYLGAKAVAPTLDNDGGALLTGALYFNTASNTMFVYTGSSWVATNASFAAPGPIGGTTPAAGTFTTLTSTADNYMAGSLGVGVVAAGGASVDVAKSMTGATTVYGIRNYGSIQSDVTTTAYSFLSNPATSGAVFSMSGGLIHFAAIQGSFGSTTVANQFGFYATSSLTGATNNYGFYSNIAAASNRYNLYCAGTADNVFMGAVGIGSAPAAGYAFQNAKSLVPSGGGAWGIGCTGPVSSSGGALSQVNYFISSALTDDAAFAITNLYHFRAFQSTISGGSRTTPTNQVGFLADAALVGATNNFGFYSNIASAANRYNIYAAGTADNYFAGAVGIGGAPYAGVNLLLNRAITGSATVSDACVVGATIQSDVTGRAGGFSTYLSTQAAAFTLANLRHYSAAQNTIGAGSTTTNQFGFYADATLTGATNNYGFYSNIAAAANRYNLYCAGTADNYMAGSLGVGVVAAGGASVDVAKSMTGATTVYGIRNYGSIQSDVTTTAYSFLSNPATSGAVFSMSGGLIHFSAIQGSFGSTTVANQFGFNATSNLTGATNNFGFYSNIASAANRYNFYAAGTAANAFSGDVKIFGAGALGYSTGSGGTITQATSRTTGVTLNKTNGQITLFSAAGSATAASFTVTNSTVAATDTIVLSVASGTNKYMVFVTAVAAGSFEITFQTTGGTSTDAPVINFAVIKAVAA